MEPSSDACYAKLHCELMRIYCLKRLKRPGQFSKRDLDIIWNAFRLADPDGTSEPHLIIRKVIRFFFWCDSRGTPWQRTIPDLKWREFENTKNTKERRRNRY